MNAAAPAGRRRSTGSGPTVVSERSPSSSGWLPGAPPGQSHARVELEELRVAEEVDRVVDDRRVAAGAVRRGDQLRDQPRRSASSTSPGVRGRRRSGTRPPGRHADRRVDDAAARGGVRVERVDDEADVGRARRPRRRGSAAHRSRCSRGSRRPSSACRSCRASVASRSAAIGLPSTAQRVTRQRAGVLDGEERQRDDGPSRPRPRGVHQVLGRALRPAVVRHHDDRARAPSRRSRGPRTRAW